MKANNPVNAFLRARSIEDDETKVKTQRVLL